MFRRMREGYSFWQGLPPPQYLFKHLAFLGVALEPPDWEPGSWTGAGKAIIDYAAKEYLLTARPRKLEGSVRGYAAEVYRSTDGVRFDRVSRLGTEEVTAQSGVKVWSIEGNQLLRDPLTGRWHFFLSVDTGHEPEVGGVFWETMLFVADDVAGPWAFRGRVIPRGQGRVFDAAQARNATIDIVDGQWLALYRATDLDWRFSMGLATSMDGVTWEKRGQLSVDGHRGFTHFATMGTLFAGTAGPVHLGLTWRRGGYGALGRTRIDFTAYRVNPVDLRLTTIFRAPWTARSPYEDPARPTYGHYCSLVYDPFEHRMLFYVSAVDPRPETKRDGQVCVRELVYGCPL